MTSDPEKQPVLGSRAISLLDTIRRWRLSDLLFDDKGRIGRHTFWLYMAGAIVLAFILLFSRSLRQTGMIQLIFGIALIYPSYCVFAKRFQDFDINGAWAVIIVGISAMEAIITAAGLRINPGALTGFMRWWEWLSLTNTIASFGILGIWPPSDGANRYGPRTPPW